MLIKSPHKFPDKLLREYFGLMQDGMSGVEIRCSWDPKCEVAYAAAELWGKSNGMTWDQLDDFFWLLSEISGYIESDYNLAGTMSKWIGLHKNKPEE